VVLVAAEPAVSVVLPTYNEAETIVGVITAARGYLNHGPRIEHGVRCVEIVVVDDDSPDGTAETVRSAFPDDEFVSVIVREEKSGLSSAVLRGLRESRGDIAIVMDADGQHPADRLPGLFFAAQDCGIATGSRFIRGGSIEGWSLARTLISAGATTFARASILSSRGLSDPMSGFFAVDRSVVDDAVLDQCDPHGYKILLELISHTDCEITEIPITFQPRQAGESKLTIDEMLRFVEHVGALGLAERDIDQWVSPPLAIRATEFGVGVSLALLAFLGGLWLGGTDGAVGGALSAVAGGVLVLSIQRLRSSAASWSESGVYGGGGS
jgi:dolichol-phosphate mannosyltransferase